MWPPCSGDFLNEDANGDWAGVPGATPTAKHEAGALPAQSKQWGQTRTLQAPRGTRLSHGRWQSETRTPHCLRSQRDAVSQRGIR